MGIQTSLDAVLGAERVVDAMRRADDLAFEASRDGGPRTIRLLTATLGGDDQLAAIAAVHALGQVVDGQADVVIDRLLSSDRRFLAEHAAWVLAIRRPQPGALGRLVAMVARGGFPAMLAQRTLEIWAAPAPDLVAVALESSLAGKLDPPARRLLVETLGLVRDRVATRPLLALALGEDEDVQVRATALAALGQRRGDSEIAALVGRLAGDEGLLGDVARIALVDLTVPADAGPVAERDEARDLAVAQLFLHADIDAGLTQAGAGDNGGIATLLVRLGDALVGGRPAEARGARVGRVITMSRGTPATALDSIHAIGQAVDGHVYGRIPMTEGPVQSADAWTQRVPVRRGIRRLLRAAGGVDAMHLRMADVGSLSAMDVARELDIPVVFTLAPDPHAVIQSLDLAGALSSRTFGDIDLAEHYWYRSRLVQQLAGNAAHTVLFPRPNLERDMRDLVGIDITARPERHTVVPEGIDLAVIDRGIAEARDHAAGHEPVEPLADLRRVLETLPAHRRGLPLVLSVGRFHRVKGMSTIVTAWRNSPLADRANVLLVGGDLGDPSRDEQEQLDRIAEVLAPDERAAAGLLMPGHRSNGTVARWLAAVRTGVPGLAAPNGVYVCGSLKEEFGIALLEAMAAGLVVVAPDGGGPATYVEQGVTGFLTQTWDPARLGEAMAEALAAAQAETGDERAQRSRATVAADFTIEAMAEALTGVYTHVRDEHEAFLDWLATAS